MTNERWQAFESKFQKAKKVPKEVILPQIEKKLDALQRVPKRVAIPTLAAAGILFPSVVYADAALEETPNNRSLEVAEFLDNHQTEIAEGVLMLAGTAITLNSYYVGKRNDEPGLRILRVSGPALLTAAAGSALLNTADTSYAIPAGLAWAGTYTLAIDNAINTLQGTRRVDIRLSSLAANAGIMAAGATIFLAAADKL